MPDGPWVKIRTRNNTDFRKRNYQKAVLFLATDDWQTVHWFAGRKDYFTIVIWEFYALKKIKKNTVTLLSINCPLAEDNWELRFVTVYLVTLLPTLLQMNLQSVTKWRNQEIRKKKEGKNVIPLRGSKDLGSIFAQPNLVVYYFSENQGKMRKWKRLGVVEAETGKKETEKSARCGENARLWSVCGLPNVSGHIFGHKYTRPWPKYEKTYPHSFSIPRWEKIEVVLCSWEIVVLEEIILRGSFGLVTLILNGASLKVLLKTSIGDKKYCEFRW